MRKRPLPIGIDDFREMIEKDYYYIDKSLLIKEWIDSGNKCTLLPRPRRFGKTLNLSMLHYFFETSGEDTSRLFRHLAIWRQGEAYIRQQGQYPVIFLTFKDIKCDSWESCFAKIKEVIGEEYRRHKAVLDSAELDADEKATYRNIMEAAAGRAAYESSVYKLSVYLQRVYKQNTIILIDEYDTPVLEGYLRGYYDEVVGFMRNGLSAALKGNRALDKAALTGILRIARKSIFSGLNNLKVRSLLDPQFSAHFGFLEHEVEEMMRNYGIGTHIEEVRSWYNGYRFGDHVVYNPWSIVNFVDNWSLGTLPYWVNTSSNDLVRQLMTDAGIQVQEQLAGLLRGEHIRMRIQDTMSFREIRNSPDALWSLLLFSGYLKAQSVTVTGEGEMAADLVIPNKEVGSVYRQIVMNWFQPPVHLAASQFENMLEALCTGNIPAFEHNFRDIRKSGIIIEFKKVDRAGKETLESAAIAALRQIDDKRYAAELQERGVRDIVRLGIAFDGKRVLVKQG